MLEDIAILTVISEERGYTLEYHDRNVRYF
jgi:hypothetical protein